jgi:hypothetical protein
MNPINTCKSLGLGALVLLLFTGCDRPERRPPSPVPPVQTEEGNVSRNPAPQDQGNTASGGVGARGH